MLLKKPGFTLIAVLTLALGIGANTAIFSVVNGVLLRPLPYDESDRLVMLSEHGTNFGEMSISYPNFSDWRSQNRVFEHIGVFNRGSYNLTGSGEPERLLAGQASADLFSALRVKAAIGRLFTNDEDKPGASRVVVLSYGLWQRRFAGDPKLINQMIRLDDEGYTVIGVMPQGFSFPRRVEIWMPVGQLSGSESWKQRGNHPGLYGVARLKTGFTIEQARADLNNVAANLQKQYPDSNSGHSVIIIPLLENYVSDVRTALWVLLGAVGFVLLIACANVGSLMLARTAARQKEIAVRAALGASRLRVIRQLLTENLLLAGLGGALGLLLAQWGVGLILGAGGDSIPRRQDISLDYRVLVFTAAVSILTGIIFGLAPAILASRPDLQEMLKDTARGTTGGRHWIRNGLVIAQMALTLVLLTGAGLLIRSFWELQKVNPGFAYDHLLSFNISLPERKYPELQQQINFFQQVTDNLRRLPGVQSVGMASGLPLGNNGWQTSFMIEGGPVPSHGQMPSMEAALADINYFRTMRIPLLRGRWFNEHDNRSHVTAESLKGLNELQRFYAGLHSIIIDEAFANRYWPNEDAVGKRVRLGTEKDDPVLTIVGVVGRVMMEGLRNNSDRVQGYFPFLETPSNGMTIVVRAQLEPEQLMAAAREQVKAVDSGQPIYEIRTLEQIHSRSVAPERFNLILLTVFAGIALVLAVVGIYGVMSYSVTQRTSEIGIRMALGAQSRHVLTLVVKQGMALALAGVSLGLVASFALTRLMENLLFGVKPTDAATFASIPLLLTAIALLACLVPARRAMKVDPMVALRYE
jgi:putative ABC transport system permease protein